MQNEPDTIPLRPQTTNLKNRFPGAAAFVETFDTDDDAPEPADILSFESLREAFATIRTAETALAQTIPEIALSAEAPPQPPELPDYEIGDVTGMENRESSPSQNTEPPIAASIRFETIIEAMLFVGNQENRPIDAEQFAGKLRNVSVEEVEQAVLRLNGQYQERNCPYTIMTDSGGYRMVLRPEFESVRTNFYGKIRGTRLSQQAIDTLAVVAYRQPITAEEIQSIRQQSCASILNQLVRRNLLRVSREVQDKKSVVRYYTTPRFLELLQIKSLDDIPQTEELDYR